MEQCAGKRIYKDRLQPVANAPAAVRKVFEAPGLDPLHRRGGYRQVQLVLGLDPRDNVREHAAKNLSGGIRTNEIEDDDVVADAVEYLRPRQAKLEVVLYGSSDLRLDLLVWILGADVLDPLAVLVLDEYSEVRRENDNRFGKIDGRSSCRGLSS